MIVNPTSVHQQEGLVDLEQACSLAIRVVGVRVLYVCLNND